MRWLASRTQMGDGGGQKSLARYSPRGCSHDSDRTTIFEPQVAQFISHFEMAS